MPGNLATTPPAERSSKAENLARQRREDEVERNVIKHEDGGAVPST